MPKPPCSISRCPREATARGWCKTHYGRWYRHGDPLYTEKPSPRLQHASNFERLSYYIDAEGDCLGVDGHGRVSWVRATLVGGGAANGSPLGLGDACRADS